MNGKLRTTTERAAYQWPDLVAALTGWRAAWADLDGMHVDVALPANLPLTSHLWAWTTGGWLRARVDGPRWWASALLDGSNPVPCELWRPRNDSPDIDTPVEVTVDRIRSWSVETEGRVAQMRIAAGTVPATMWQLVPVAARTAVYVGGPHSYPAA